MTTRRADESSTEDSSEQSERLFSEEMVDRLKSALTFGEPIPTLPKSTRFQKGNQAIQKEGRRKRQAFRFIPGLSRIPYRN
ncbi:MAG: hypothetical protein ACR65X_09785 [Methylocystis sp.]